MNKVILIGNLTRDPEISETSSGISVCRFAIAVNRNYASSDGERKTDFFNITAWRGLGENVYKYAKKGNKVCVLGQIEIRNYDDSQGNKRTAVDIVASDVEFLTPKSSQSLPDEFSAPSSNAGGGSSHPTLQNFDDEGDDMPF